MARTLRSVLQVTVGLCAVGALSIGVSAISPFTPTGYVARAAFGEARLLLGRVPLAEAPAPTDPRRAENLARVPKIKAFAQDTLGLEAGGIYDTIHPTWDEVVWNVAACRPLAFRPKRYRFPIVGAVPYLGYFDEATARKQAARLEAEGYETYVRTAGTFSTLGWFDDPLLPGMLDWSEARLADTLIHELVHANVWVPGSAIFNESFANFVGHQGAERWLVATYGAGSAEHTAYLDADADGTRWRLLLAGLVTDLEAIYARTDAPESDRLRDKAAAIGSLPARVEAAGFADPERFRKQADPSAWNNARLLQYRTYNRGQDAFDALLQRSGGDLRAMIDLVRGFPRGTDPWDALEAASGVEVEPGVSGS